MKTDRLQQIIDVVNNYTDIKSLIGGYNCHTKMAEYDKQENHPFLKFEGTSWTRERLNENVEWHEKIAGLVAEKLENMGVPVGEESFWDNSTFTPIKGLSYIKSKESRTFEMVEDNFNLEDDLHRSDRIKELVKEEKFAQALYAGLCNIGWRKSGIEWACSWRYAGGIVADLRNVNEDYMSYYCSGMLDENSVSEGHLDPKVREELAKIEWFPNETDIQKNLGF